MPTANLEEPAGAMQTRAFYAALESYCNQSDFIELLYASHTMSWVLLQTVVLCMLVAKLLQQNASDPLQCSTCVYVASFTQ